MMITNQKLGEIITFYSYKGGTGRSMALANVACILAERETKEHGKGVLMIDWDLEAPGLHRYFGSWMTTSKIGIDTIESEQPIEVAPGLIDLFYKLEQEFDRFTKTQKESKSEKSLSTSERVAKSVVDGFDFSSFVLPTTISNLSLIKAGRFSTEALNDYSSRVNNFDWKRLFAKSPHLLRVLCENLAQKYSYVLIDSRTGISDISGISTMLLPDKLVVVFTPNLQSLRGGLELVRKAAAYRKESVDLRPLTVFPLVSRVENSEPDLKKVWRFGSFDAKGYQHEFEEVLSNIYGERIKLNDYFDIIQLQHVPRYAYGEEIALLVERTSDRLSLSQSYQAIADKLISDDIPWEVEVSVDVEELTPVEESSRTSSTATWDDVELESRLAEALNSFNWQTTQEICDEIIQRIRSESVPIAEPFARRLLFFLRRKQQFALITKLADAMFRSGVRSLQIRRQYAQALIDQEQFTSAESILQSIIQDAQQNKTEELEARGLIGRLYKQLYVTSADPRSPSSLKNLERSLSEYLLVYNLNPKENLWHGINVVALSARARRDGVTSIDLPDPQKIAGEILAVILQKEEESFEPLPSWDLATQLEAYVALNETEHAARTARRYVDTSAADAFELASTISQFELVWQLKDTEQPGDLLMPLLRAAYLTKTGSNTKILAAEIKAEVTALGENLNSLEPILGLDNLRTYKWYKKGLEQCNSIARIERHDGRAIGTGYLVDAADFFPGEEGMLLLTCNHLVSPSPTGYGITPKDCQINFESLGQVFEVNDNFVWFSPHTELDVTFLRLTGQPHARALTLHNKPVVMTQPPSRLYVIGYQDGRDLEFSVQDNYLIASNETHLYYRALTEPGSSGSAIFESEDWRVVGIHHASRKVPGLSEHAGTHESNEGVSILAIQKVTRKSSGTAS